MFLTRGQDRIIQDIEKRIADYTFIPIGMYEKPLFLVADILYLDLFLFLTNASSHYMAHG